MADVQLVQSSDCDSVAEPHATARLTIGLGTGPGRETAQPVTVALEHSVSMYTVYRGYLVHEDDLVHQRTTWSITIQGFLIVAFGLAFSNRMKIFGVQPGTGSQLAALDRQYTSEIIVLAILGIGVSLICLLAVLAAQRAIDGLRRNWAQWYRARPGLPDYPDLTGGGDGWATFLGHQLPVCLQGFFALFWMLVVVVLLSKPNLVDYLY